MSNPYADDRTKPYRHAFVMTPGNGGIPWDDKRTNAIIKEGPGDVTFLFCEDADPVTFEDLEPGVVYRFAVSQLVSAGDQVTVIGLV